MARRIVVVTFPGAQVLDVTGPAEVFSTANRLRPTGDAVRYEIVLVATEAGPVATSGGIEVVAHRPLRSIRGAVDTLLVVGGDGSAAAAGDARLLSWLRRTAPRCRRVGSVCSGAFILAAAGLLDGRRATTHWGSCDLLAQLFPAVTVEPDPIFVRDGDVWTSAGVTAGMDLALAMVEEDHGREAALDVARWLVLFLQRPGGQSQFSAPLAAQLAARPGLRDLQAWMVANPAADLSVPALAGRAHMSERTFARSFRADLGTTPGSYVESIRVEAARRLLEASDEGLGEVAAECGFGTVETLHRTFRRHVGTTPAQYRKVFRPRPA